VNTITTQTIRDAFITAILAITPTMEELRSAAWSYTPSGRTRGRAAIQGQATRTFDIIFGPGVPNYLLKGGVGTSYTCRVAVATAYAVEPQLLDHILTADFVDLRRALMQQVDPTLDGLISVDVRNIENASVDDRANCYVEHAFQICYHQATDS
jgi:hypothetical protein